MPLKVYLGWDKRDALAYAVARASILATASGPVEIIPLKDWVLREAGLYWRSYWVNPRGQMFDDIDSRPFTTDFTYQRFLIPALERFEEGRVIFADGDTLWRGDICALANKLPDGKAVACVKHEHAPAETVKVTGNLQQRYPRKNWSSVMVLDPSRCRLLTPYQVNRASRDWLHGLDWAPDRDIEALPIAWNWLDGYSPDVTDPKVVHFTRGTPDMKNRTAGPYDWEWRQIADKLKPEAFGV